MTIIIRKALFLGLQMFMSAALASPYFSTSEVHYPIAGRNAEDLLQQMNAVGPTVNGEHFHAVTEYFIKWDTTYHETNDHCKVMNQHVTLFTTMKYPEWINYPSASQGMQRNWKNFLVRIHAHEEGHRRHGEQAAQEVEAMISHLPMMANCDQLEKAVKEKTNAIIAKYKSRDVEYDRATKHGAEQVYA